MVAKKGALLGKNALRELGQTVDWVRRQQGVDLTTGPQRENADTRPFPVIIGARIGVTATYGAEEVIYDDSASSWEVLENGRTFGDATEDIAPLYELNESANVPEGTLGVVFPRRSKDGLLATWYFADPTGLDDVTHFSHFKNDTSLTFHEGFVFVGNDDMGTKVDGALGPYDRDTPQKFWVEVTSTPGTTGIIVTTDIKFGIAWPEDADHDPTTRVVIKSFPLLEIEDDESVTIWHEGDINFTSGATQPEFPEEVRPSTTLKDAANTAMVEEANTLTTSAGKTFALKGRIVELLFRLSGLRQVTSGDEFEVGGTNVDVINSQCSDFDLSTENEVEFVFDQLSVDVEHGLMQNFSSAAGVNLVLTTLNKWVGMELAPRKATFKHLTSPVTSDSDDEHWKTVITSGGTIYIDEKGHVWKVDAATQPTIENYRYVHCSDTGEDDLIFSSQQADVIVEVDGNCYEEAQDTTEDDATDPVPTVVDTFSDCSTCNAAGENEIWYRCDNDVEVARYDPSNAPENDYAWLCLSSIYVKCYGGNLSSESALEPSFIEQCGTAPTECADLVGRPVSDDFGGTGCDSGDFGDIPWNLLYKQTLHDPNTQFNAGQMEVELNSPSGQKLEGWSTRDIGHVGDFVFRKNYTSLSRTSGDIGLVTNCIVSGGLYQGSRFMSGSVNKIDWATGFTNISAGAHLSGYLEFSRVGNTLSLKFNGTTYKTWTVSGTLDRFDFGLFAYSGNPSKANANLTGNTLVNGSSTDISIDPTGDSCT